MKKEIRINIKSERFETGESYLANLMSMSENEEGFFLDGDIAENSETIEINSVGFLVDEDKRLEIAYDETELTGMEGSKTSLSFKKDAPEIVSMLRSGTVSTALVFEAGKRHHCVYNTPVMPFEICVHTIRVDNEIVTAGTLELDYVIEIRGAMAERTKFSLRIY